MGTRIILAALALLLEACAAAQTTSVAVGPNTSGNGTITLYPASGGGSVQLTVLGPFSTGATATLPNGVNGNIVIDSGSNVFTGKNDFSSSVASVVLPNVAAFSPNALGQVAYDTTQQDLVSRGNQNLTGSLRRVLSVAVPATADVICAEAGDATIGNCANTADATANTAFQTTFAIPAGFLLSGKRLIFTADFKLFNSGSTPTVTVGMFLDNATTGEALYQSAPLLQPTVSHSPPNGIGFSGSWALTGASALGMMASTITNALSLNFAGAAFAGIANAISQPPAGWSTNAPHTIVFTVLYALDTPGNAIQLQTLTVEELN